MEVMRSKNEYELDVEGSWNRIAEEVYSKKYGNTP
jgi:hypothetical protein